MWWQYIIIAAVIVLGIYGFLVLTRFETWNLSRRTTRTAQDLYPNYADSLRKQRRYARQHGGQWTSDDGGQPREPKGSQPHQPKGTQPREPKGSQPHEQGRAAPGGPASGPA